MRRNLIVLGGVVIVLLSLIYLPLLSATMDGSETTLRSHWLASIILLLLTLFFMIFRWSFRGVFWILIGIVGALMVPSLMVSMAKVFIEIGRSIYPDSPPIYGEISYLPGMYVLILGFLLIAGGGFWDIYQKISSKPMATKTETAYSALSKTPPVEETPTLSFVCHFSDGRREFVDLPKNNKVTIGSHAMVDIHTQPDESVDFQVTIKKARNIYYLDVLDPTFPTRLNSQIITQSRKLNDGDIIEVGDVSIAVAMPG